MDTPDNVFPSQIAAPNYYATSNPVLNNLFKTMAGVEPLYMEFSRLHDEALAAQNPNPHNQVIPTLISRRMMDYDNLQFVGSFMSIISFVNNVDFTSTESLEFAKMRVAESLSAVERHFFIFNQKFQASPAIMNIIRQMYELFSAVKKELEKLGLFVLPKLELSAQPELQVAGDPQRRDRADSDNSAEPAPDAERYQARKRM